MKSAIGPMRVVRAAAGRADLLRALAEGGDPALAAMAGLLGFAQIPRNPADPAVSVTAPRDVRFVETALPAAEPTPVSSFAPVPLWRLERVEHLQSEEAPGPLAVPPLSSEDIGPAPQAREPRPPTLVSWPRLWPVLDRRLRTAREGREVDSRRLVEQWSRGEIARRVPRRASRAASGRVTLLQDRGTRLAPCWTDQDELYAKLVQRLGRNAVRVLEHTPAEPSRWRQARGSSAAIPRVEPGEPVLALSDLGAYGDLAERSLWRRLAWHLREQGARLSALVPAPASRWRWVDMAPWSPLEWARPHGRAGRHSPPPDAATLEGRVSRIVALLSPALRVEPGLLRNIRGLLPLEEADLGTEFDVWNHGAHLRRSTETLRVEVGALEGLRLSFAAEAPELRERVVACLRNWHEPAAREVWLAEVLVLDLLGLLPEGFKEEGKKARQFALRLARTLLEPGATRERLVRASARWLLYVSLRVPPSLWRDSELGPVLTRAWALAAEQTPDAPAPAGLTLRSLPAVKSPRRWNLWQVRDEIRLRGEGEDLRQGEGGGLLGSLLVASGEIAWAPTSSMPATRLELKKARRGWAAPSSPFLFIKSDRQELHFTRYQREEWANAGAGRDKHGLWAAFEVEGVEHRFRWIPPGRFWMGSPESEKGRIGREGPRHLVTLTEGFWLGEAPVTQALWQVVMGENPSYFVSPDRPVEQVSWEECQEFMRRLAGKEEAKDLGARLPWEAEWEYACRAGTQTSTFAGELEILGERNAPLLDSIAWYAGNSGEAFELETGVDSSGWKEKQYDHKKAGTHPVKGKPANPWGLYDMLGNVWEWCQDHGEWGQQYSPNTVPYPRGPEVGSRRVVRGGSWLNLARRVRAASRFWNSPESRYDIVGFRLARGQSAQPVGGAPEPAGHPRGREAAASGEGRASADARRPRGGGKGKAGV